MKVKVLGGHGGLAKSFSTTSFLIDDVLLIDAGAVASTLSVEEQIRIEHILISHCHLDHTKDLAFLCDNCFGLRSGPFDVYTHATVKKIIKDHLFNDIVWPDFTILPTESNPTMRIHAITPEEEFKLGEYLVRPVRVNHPHDAMGFFITKKDTTVLLTLDTGPTEKIWEFAHQYKKLKAIFTEVSFPNSLGKVAILSDHHTPKSLEEELAKVPQGIPIILTHLKPNYREEILKEIKHLSERQVRVLEQDGEEFKF